MKTVVIDSDFITLAKFLKFVGEVNSGGQTTELITKKLVKINGEFAQFKRQKLTNNSVIKINNNTYKIETAK